MSDRSDFEPDAQMPTDLAGFMSMVQQESEAVSDEPEEEEVPQVEEDLTEFEGDIGSELVGVINLGNMQKEYPLFGHRFVLKTLKIGEELAIAKVIDEYQQTVGQGRAYATGLVAASVVTVDGHVPARGLGPDVVDDLQSRFNYILERWDWDVVFAVHECYQDLCARKQRVYALIRSKS